MAEQIKKVLTIEIDVESGEMKQLGTEVKKVSDETQKVAKNTKEATKGVGGIAKGFTKVGLALKAAGIGFVIALLATLKEVFSENQAVVDTFSTAMTGLKIAFNDFFKFVSANLETVTGFFKKIFDDPLGSIKALGEAIKENIIERFNSLLDTLGYAGDALKKFFEGDFNGAIESAKQAGKELVDVYTGVNNSFDRTVDFVSEAASAIVDYTTETWKSADAITQQAKATKMLELQQQRLREQYDRDAENQRQIRDDETKTISKRIEANRRLGEVLNEQQIAEQETVKKRIANLQNLQNQLGFNQERYEEIYALQTELIAIEAQQAGFKSEQLTNENSLLREQTDAIKELDAINSDSTVAQLIALEQLYDERVLLANKFVDDEVERKRYLEEIEADHKAKIKAIEDAAAAEKKKKDADELKAAQELNQAKMGLAIDAFGALIALNNAFAGATEEQQRKAFQRDKALKIGQAIMSTAQAVTSALAQTIDPTPLQVLRFGNAAVAAAMGIAQVATIAKTQFNPSGGSSSGGGMPSISAPTSGGGAPQFNTVGTSGFNQLSDSIAGQNNRPVQAYVVANNVSSAQSLERNRVQQASFP